MQIVWNAEVDNVPIEKVPRVKQIFFVRIEFEINAYLRLYLASIPFQFLSKTNID